MLWKLSVLLVVYQIVRLSQGAAIPNLTTCATYGQNCSVTNDCCQNAADGPQICGAFGKCIPPSGNPGPPANAVGSAVVLPPNPGCPVFGESCNGTCCAPYICQYGIEICVEYNYLGPWGGR